MIMKRRMRRGRSKRTMMKMTTGKRKRKRRRTRRSRRRRRKEMKVIMMAVMLRGPCACYKHVLSVIAKVNYIKSNIAGTRRKPVSNRPWRSWLPERPGGGGSDWRQALSSSVCTTLALALR
ncbi:hypothetical protein PoB_004719400 [Plakobranchus ocellatus]|uniref:Uncharacterized protein n=1 Tax=Plakobranchus ocellatus TaxID=259542 RepID=A0AAV4BKK8_9GAST|nr:hypothetical protein PoB_004719400 [Plakobranchus ocellatus]